MYIVFIFPKNRLPSVAPQRFPMSTPKSVNPRRSYAGLRGLHRVVLFLTILLYMDPLFLARENLPRVILSRGGFSFYGEAVRFFGINSDDYSFVCFCFRESVQGKRKPPDVRIRRQGETMPCKFLFLFVPGTIVNIVAALDALDVNQFAAAMVAHIQLMADMRAKLRPFSGLVLGDDPSRVFVDESSLSVSLHDFQLRFVFIQLGNHGVPRTEFFPALFHFGDSSVIKCECHIPVVNFTFPFQKNPSVSEIILFDVL